MILVVVVICGFCCCYGDFGLRMVVLVILLNCLGSICSMIV